MRIFFSVIALALTLNLFLGCESQSSTVVTVKPTDETASHSHEAPIDEATIEEAFAQLSPEDRAIAESQKFCAVATENPLGSMGTPLKIEVNGETVFLCCSGCQGKAVRNPEETLASVAKLKSANTASK